MFDTLPGSALDFLAWDWAAIAPYYADLMARKLTSQTVDQWLRDWSKIEELLDETYWRLYVATSINTGDMPALERYDLFVGGVQSQAKTAAQGLKEKLITSGLEPQGFGIPLHNMRLEASIFSPTNQPLLIREKKLGSDYVAIRGGQTIEWDGRQVSAREAAVHMIDPNRETRRTLWERIAERRLADREPINKIWAKLVKLRHQLARNANLPDYRAYRWRQLLRSGYTPEDCEVFHRAIEEVVVPAASAIYDARRKRLGLDRVRPWDASWEFNVNPEAQHATIPVDVMTRQVSALFNRLDPALGNIFETMRRDSLLDLDSRPGKALGAYCTSYAYSRQPFIYSNGPGLPEDVITLIHEAGHAFHWQETYHLPYYHQRGIELIPVDFVEVASTAMEFLALPLLGGEGGLYSPEQARRIAMEHMEYHILHWGHVAVMDAFQHWVYTHPDEASDPAASDDQWMALWLRYMPGVDWSGYEDVLKTGWQQKPHLFEVPFYYIEYGLARVGAVQVWQNALKDQAGALRQYRAALALGNTASLPELFAAAGARFAFDTPAVKETVDAILAAYHEWGRN
jgi:oligoendopeptidase F